MTYLQHYEEMIEPQLQQIDVFIKAQDPITVNSLAQLLSISELEIHSIVSEENITQLNKMTFFMIMKKGSSPICKLFNRELERKTFNNYSIEDVSYIYDIPVNKVLEASNTIETDIFNSSNIRTLFSYIKL
ncbi:hypothetical protein [Vallitalea okinawensis]|uniref:hypothetical protein n=1 Tax=Vallitalea okinawensis TaxID=2078660 RepID=UPI000CFAF4F5|nr:hypothetical protein [Vallitalea okinawensis]